MELIISYSFATGLVEEASTRSLQDLSRVLPSVVLEASLEQPVELVGKDLVDLELELSLAAAAAAVLFAQAVVLTEALTPSLQDLPMVLPSVEREVSLVQLVDAKNPADLE